MDTADRLDIHELLARYGHLIDARDWAAGAALFTDDAIYDMTELGMGVATGPAEINAMWTGPTADHPVAHHATNIVIEIDSGGTVRVMSKGIGVGAGGRVGSVSYDDVVVKTTDGWRFARRSCRLHRSTRAGDSP